MRMLRAWFQAGWTSREALRQSEIVTAPRHNELEVVEFLTESGRWPAGTVGTVVEASAASALIEIADNRGRAIDFVSLPHHALASVEAGTTRAAS